MDYRAYDEFHSDIAEYAPQQTTRNRAKRKKRRYIDAAKLAAASAVVGAATLIASVTVNVTLENVNSHSAELGVIVSVLGEGEAGDFGYELSEAGGEKPLYSGRLEDFEQKMTFERLKPQTVYIFVVLRSTSKDSSKPIAERAFTTPP